MAELSWNSLIFHFFPPFLGFFHLFAVIPWRWGVMAMEDGGDKHILVVTPNRSKVWIMKAVAIFFAMEILMFLLGAAAGFAVGASNGGIQEGFRIASASTGVKPY